VSGPCQHIPGEPFHARPQRSDAVLWSWRGPGRGTVWPMGTIIRLLFTKLLPGRLAWVVAAFVVGRALAARRANPVPVREERVTRTW
jgi:hypothetical protein